MRASADLTDDELAYISAAPKQEGTVQLIVARPSPEERLVLDTGELTVDAGLVGDDWATRAPGSERRECQLTLMNARAAEVIAGPPEHWPPAGDQLFVDLDVGVQSLTPGTVLRLGTAEVEITDEPHLGCGKFIRRYGVNAQKLVNSPVGRELRLRGVYAHVTQSGTVRAGDAITRINPGA